MSDGLAFKSFVSETELNEKRKKRQEEWEKVRTADQPEECPEEEYDNRSLFDRLQEQKDKKQAEYDDQHQFKNMVRGLDDDESKFLDEVAERQMEIDLLKRKEEKDIMREVEEYKNRVLSADDPSSSAAAAAASSAATKSATAKEPKKSADTGVTKKKSQASLLAGAVKRKTSDSADDSQVKKSKVGTSSSNNTSDSAPQSSSTSSPSAKNGTVLQQGAEVEGESAKVKRAQVVAVLPGLGHYANSEDSDTSESDGDEELDFTGPLVAPVGLKKKRAVPH